MLLITAGLYGHTLHVPFYLDDNALFSGTYLLRDLAAAAQNLFSQRGLTNLTFALNYRLADWSLAALHLVNIAFHLFCALLVWRLLRQLMRGRWLPLLGALLFIAHPLQTQGVTYLAQRSTVQGAFFFLLAFFFHLQARSQLAAGAVRTSSGYLLPHVAAVVAGMCAVLSKENTATLPLVLMAYDQFFPLPDRRTWTRATCDYLPFFPVPLLLGAVVLGKQVGVKVAGFSYYPLESLLHNDPLHYLVTQFSVMWSYLRLLILPYGQALEHDYPVVSNLLTVRSGVSLAGLLAVGWLAWWVRRRRPLLAFGVVWFFLALAVESSVIPLDPLFEHRLYLPFFGFLLVLLDGLRWSLGEKRAVPVLVVVLLVCLPLTWQRNALWNDPIAFYEDNLKVVPGSERAMVDLAFRYEEAGQYANQRRLLEQAVRLHPLNHDFYAALAKVYADQLGFPSAIDLLEQGLKRMPHNLELYERAALLAEKFGKRELIFDYLQRGLAAIPDNKERLLNDLGIYYAQQGNFVQAENLYRQSMSLNPDNPVAYEYLGGLYFAQQRWTEALKMLKSANRLEPGNPKILEGIGKTALKLGDMSTVTWAADKLRYVDPEVWSELQTALDQYAQGNR